jgi:hypothetical protein
VTRSTCEVADVVERHGEAFVRTRAVNVAKVRALRSIQACRTAALGGRKLRCESCDHTVVLYNSCRNRHCPKCGGGQREKWVERQRRRLLPVNYFHVVFTLPQQLAAIALQNQRHVYGLVLRAAAATLKQLASDPKHLGARIGVTTVLHTWGQSMEHHPHVHCLVPGGGLDPTGERWRPCRRNFLLPVRALRKLFRGKVIADLGDAYREGRLELHGRLEHLREPDAFWQLLRPLRKRKWVVYAKSPAAGPEVVLEYLARYVGRVAIANSRIVAIDDHRVSFRWLDRRDGKRKLMSLDGPEFLRRFCLHLLPRGFVRIRHSGLLANRAGADLCRCRELLTNRQESATPPEPDTGPGRDRVNALYICPECDGVLSVVVTVLRQPQDLDIYALWMDSS